MTPKAHEVVERVEKAAPKYTGETCSSTRRDAWIEGAHFGIRLALGLEGIEDLVFALDNAKDNLRLAIIYLDAIVHLDGPKKNLDYYKNELEGDIVEASEALAAFQAFKLLHVPSGGVE